MNVDDPFLIQKISPQFTLLIDDSIPKFNLTDKDEALIDHIWQQQVELSGGRLFNGKMLRFSSLSQERMVGEFIEYKYYLVQLVAPTLASLLHIQPISVSGITIAGDKVLCGRRAQHVTQYPGCFELVPSGGMDPAHEDEGVLNIEEQLVSELVEEAGIVSKNVLGITPIAWVFDTHKDGFEICMAIQAAPEAVSESFPSSLEYDTLSWLSKKTLKKELQKHAWVPLSAYMINHFDILR